MTELLYAGAPTQRLAAGDRDLMWQRQKVHAVTLALLVGAVSSCASSDDCEPPRCQYSRGQLYTCFKLSLGLFKSHFEFSVSLRVY